MFRSHSMTAIIADYKTSAVLNPTKSYRKNLDKLSKRITEFSFTSRQCSYVLDEIFYCYVYLNP